MRTCQLCADFMQIVLYGMLVAVIVYAALEIVSATKEKPRPMWEPKPKERK